MGHPADLDDELSQIEQEKAPLPASQVKAQILAALKQSKDIDFYALEKALATEGTSVEKLLDCAVAEAEGRPCEAAQASGRGRSNWTLVLVADPAQDCKWAPAPQPDCKVAPAPAQGPDPNLLPLVVVKDFECLAKLALDKAKKDGQTFG
ncbi:MAG: hypothetical protein P4M04_00410 [Acidobacteriota bacterium]|nr:hypothetical protein [Acidobacteriota bacterium]